MIFVVICIASFVMQNLCCKEHDNGISDTTKSGKGRVIRLF